VVNDLTILIGQAIHHCGGLELLVNNEIRALANDDLLTREVVSYTLRNRIHILGKLLRERSGLKSDEISSLCRDLLTFA